MNDQKKLLLFSLISFLLFSFLFKNSVEETLNKVYLEQFGNNYPSKIIWMYWENAPGKQKPYFIELCHRLVKEKNPNTRIIILNPSNIKKYIPIPNSWYHLQHIAHRADYVRIAILYHYGGIYIDSDMVALQSFDPIFGLLNNYDFVAYEYQSKINKSKKSSIGSYYDYIDIKKGNTQHTYRIPIGFLASKPKTPLFKEWLNSANDVLNQSYLDKGKLLWHNMGRKILTPMLEKQIKEGKMTYYGIPAETTIAPIKSNNNKKFFQDLPLKFIIKSSNRKNICPKSKNFNINYYQPFIVLFNSLMPKLKEINPSSIQEQKDLINKLFYHALIELSFKKI